MPHTKQFAFECCFITLCATIYIIYRIFCTVIRRYARVRMEAGHVFFAVGKEFILTKKGDIHIQAFAFLQQLQKFFSPPFSYMALFNIFFVSSTETFFFSSCRNFIMWTQSNENIPCNVDTCANNLQAFKNIFWLFLFTLQMWKFEYGIDKHHWLHFEMKILSELEAQSNLNLNYLFAWWWNNVCKNYYSKAIQKSKVALKPWYMTTLLSDDTFFHREKSSWYVRGFFYERERKKEKLLFNAIS